MDSGKLDQRSELGQLKKMTFESTASHHEHKPSEKKSITEQTYIELISQIKSIVSDEKNLIANLANASSLFYHTLTELGHPINWFGFYLVDLKSPNELVLGPFHGKLACTRIKFTRGVCGACISRKETIVAKNVHDFAGHIACDSASNSEVCVPLFLEDGKAIGLIDVDSTAFEQFTEEVDGKYLKELSHILTQASDLSLYQ